ncbi:MAG: hypothetical protein ACOX2N_05930 [Peptococcia bacterium]
MEEILTTFQVKVAGKGLSGLQQILIRESREKGEILRKYPEVVGVCQSEKTRAAGAMLGRKIEIIWGRDWLEEK